MEKFVFWVSSDNACGVDSSGKVPVFGRHDDRGAVEKPELREGAHEIERAEQDL